MTAENVEDRWMCIICYGTQCPAVISVDANRQTSAANDADEVTMTTPATAPEASSLPVFMQQSVW